MLLRSMSPDVIAVDELGGESDIEALNQLVSCGIRILGSVHGTNADDLRRKNSATCHRTVCVYRP